MDGGMDNNFGLTAQDQVFENFDVTELEDQDLEDASGCQSNCGCMISEDGPS